MYVLFYIYAKKKKIKKVVVLSLQQSHLPEAAEILDILNRIEFEGLFYSHDKLADLQVDSMS